MYYILVLFYLFCFTKFITLNHKLKIFLFSFFLLFFLFSKPKEMSKRMPPKLVKVELTFEEPEEPNQPEPRSPDYAPVSPVTSESNASEAESNSSEDEEPCQKRKMKKVVYIYLSVLYPKKNLKYLNTLQILEE